MKEFDHVMVDIETLGNISYSVIATIGAVEFDIETGETGREFHEVIDIQSCLDEGLIVNGSTIMWWLENSEESIKKLGDNPRPLKEVLAKFVRFLMEMHEDVQLWGNSARFDLGLLQNAYNKVHKGQYIPWNMRNERCVRTLVSFAPEIKKEICESEGVSHNAVEDCKQQIRYCTKIWNKLNR